MTKAMRQEALPASETIDEVAAGVLRMQLPVSLPGLKHVNCYGFVDRRGLAIVDRSMNSGIERFCRADSHIGGGFGEVSRSTLH